MTEQIEQWICIKFCIELECPSTEIIWVIQKATAMGNWWLAASSQQHTHYASRLVQFFGETSNHPHDSAPYSPDLVPWDFGLFPNLKSPLKGNRSSMRFTKIWQAADGDWENCVKSQGAYFEGDWGIIVLCTMFLVSSSVNVSIFHVTWLDTYWRDLVLYVLQFS